MSSQQPCWYFNKHSLSVFVLFSQGPFLLWCSMVFLTWHISALYFRSAKSCDSLSNSNFISFSPFPQFHTHGSILHLPLAFPPCRILSSELELFFPSFLFSLADSPQQQPVPWICKNSLWTSKPANWRWRAVRTSPVAPWSLCGAAGVRKAQAELPLRGPAQPLCSPLP